MPQINEISLTNFRLTSIQEICGQLKTHWNLEPQVVELLIEDLLHHSQCNYTRMIGKILSYPDSNEYARCLIRLVQETRVEIESVASVLSHNVNCDITIQKTIEMLERINRCCHRIILGQIPIVRETE